MIRTLRGGCPMGLNPHPIPQGGGISPQPPTEQSDIYTRAHTTVAGQVLGPTGRTPLLRAVCSVSTTPRHLDKIPFREAF